MSLSTPSLRRHEEPPPPYSEDDPLQNPLVEDSQEVRAEPLPTSLNNPDHPPIYTQALRSDTDDDCLGECSLVHSNGIPSVSNNPSSPLSQPGSEPVILGGEGPQRSGIGSRSQSQPLPASEPQAPTLRIHPAQPAIDPDPSGSASQAPPTSELARLVVAHSESLPAIPLKANQRHGNSSSSLSLSSLHAQAAGKTSASGDQIRYRIGSRTVAGSLVGVESIKAHLGLLAAFKRLRQRVGSCPDEDLPDIAQFLDGPQRWAWFVGLAVERFQRWLKYVKRTELATWVMDDIPPLDVLMIWHSYMLNPIWYAEDCDRISSLGTLRLLNDHFVPAVILMGDLAQYEPCEERILSWFEQTDTPFDPLHSMQVLLHRAVRCPGCGRSNDIPFLDQDGTGYLQRNFRYICICSLGITKSALALDKFAGDLVTGYRTNTIEPEKSLAGTLHTRTQQRDWLRAINTKSNIIGSPGGPFRPDYKIMRNEWKHFIKERYGFSITNIPKGIPTRFTRTMNAYTDDRPFSVDLAAAVLRQGAFIDTLDDLGWTAPGFFDDPDNQELLAHALARYHAFLDLLSNVTNASYVPTLDIDLVWHTHQLKGSEYLNECKELVGWYVDHDDKVEETHLTQSLDETCKAWQQRFGLPYMHCGCPLPDNPMSSKFSSLTRRLGSSKDHTLSLTQPVHPGAPAATHASEHNAVRVSAKRVHPFTQSQIEARRKARVQELRRRRERDGKRVLDGKMDEDLYRRGLTHISSSSMPVPGAEGQSPAGASERWAAPCVVSFPGAFGTTGVGSCVSGITGLYNT